MKCKKVQDRLITEYLDNELGADERSGIERHLSGCLSCREFFETVQKKAVVPLKGAGEMRPDDAVWERIQEKIEAERAHSGGGFWKWVDVFVSRIPLPVPLMRAAFLTVLILGVVALAQWPSGYGHPAYAYVEEQMTLMEELGSGNVDLMNGDLNDYDAFFEQVEI